MQLQRFCASLYGPGGRLGYALARNGNGAAQPKPDEFRVRWLPPTVMHHILYRLFSASTKRFLKGRKLSVLNCSKGFVTEIDPVTNEAQMYTGNYILQLSKAFSVYLRAGNAGVDATEDRLACNARYSAVKNATLLRKLRSKAVVDDIFVDAVAPLDLRYSWDLTLFAAMCDAESLALRRMEVYQQDHGDCVMVAQGEEVTLPKTKADQLAEGVKRLKSHANKCPCAGSVGSFSMESACKRSSDGKTLNGEFRCGVCAKRLLFATQGDRPADEPRPSFIRLTRRAKPSWMDKDKDTPNAKTASPADFVYGEALPYEEFALMFNQLLKPLNERRQGRGLPAIAANHWHWHGLRHGCAVNLSGLNPPMSELQVATWCRMSLWILQYYLKHNRTGIDPTNRTADLPGCNSLTLQSVAQWCARTNSLMTKQKIESVLTRLELGTFDNFVECTEDILKAEMHRISASAGEQVAVLKAHKHYQHEYNQQAAAMAHEEVVDEEIACDFQGSFPEGYRSCLGTRRF